MFNLLLLLRFKLWFGYLSHWPLKLSITKSTLRASQLGVLRFQFKRLMNLFFDIEKAIRRPNTISNADRQRLYFVDWLQNNA